MGLKRRSKVSAEFNMSSLTDIIFLLLIFFMLTSNLVSPNALNLQLPSSASTTESPKNFASVSINRKGEYFVGSQKVKRSRLSKALRAEIKAKRVKARDFTVVLNAEVGVPIEKVVGVMDIAQRLGVKMNLSTEPN